MAHWIGVDVSKSTCRWPECASCDVVGWGYCDRHYRRGKVVNDFSEPWIAWELRYPKQCIWPECESKPYSRKMCQPHYRRAAVVGTFKEPWAAWDAANARICEYCGGAFIATRPFAKYCSSKCGRYGWARDNPERDAANIQRNVRKRRARMMGVKAERFTNADVRMAHGDDCYLCGDRINFKLRHPHPLSPSLDHVVPISRGGTHTLDNAAMTHLICNRKKYIKPVDTEPMVTLFAML